MKIVSCQVLFGIFIGGIFRKVKPDYSTKTNKITWSIYLYVND